MAKSEDYAKFMNYYQDLLEKVNKHEIDIQAIKEALQILKGQTNDKGSSI